MCCLSEEFKTWRDYAANEDYFELAKGILWNLTEKEQEIALSICNAFDKYNGNGNGYGYGDGDGYGYGDGYG